MIQLAHAVHRPCPSIYVCGNKIVIVTIIIKRGIIIIPPRGHTFQRRGDPLLRDRRHRYVESLFLFPFLSLFHITSLFKYAGKISKSKRLLNGIKTIPPVKKYYPILWIGFHFRRI